MSETASRRDATDGYILELRDLPLADGRPVTMLIDGEAEEVAVWPPEVSPDQAAGGAGQDEEDAAAALAAAGLPGEFVFSTR